MLLMKLNSSTNPPVKMLSSLLVAMTEIRVLGSSSLIGDEMKSNAGMTLSRFGPSYRGKFAQAALPCVFYLTVTQNFNVS